MFLRISGLSSVCFLRKKCTLTDAFTNISNLGGKAVLFKNINAVDGSDYNILLKY
jgi:hypothetical protein